MKLREKHEVEFEKYRLSRKNELEQVKGYHMDTLSCLEYLIYNFFMANGSLCDSYLFAVFYKFVMAIAYFAKCPAAFVIFLELIAYQLITFFEHIWNR